MVKYPDIGKVKTRLADHIGDTCALNLYKLFVSDSINKLQKENLNLHIAYMPLHLLPHFKAWLGHDHTYLPQLGDNLGERLISVFRAAFESGMEFAVALASDTPDLPAAFISEAIDTLLIHDMVIGPCPDGGYLFLVVLN